MRVLRCFSFIDLSGFTALTAHEGDERAVSLLTTFRSIVREICSRRGVRIDKWLGDGAMLVSTHPTPMLATLLEIDHSMKAARVRLQVRCGAAVGEVILHEGDDYIGHPVNMAARLCDLAAGGEVLITREVAEARPRWARVTSSRGQDVKGYDEPVEVVTLGLAALEGQASSCPVCGIPLNATVADSASHDAAGGTVLFCADSCRETWERRPTKSSEHQGSLRSPLMGS